MFNNPGTLSSEEYEKRKILLQNLKGLSKSEYIEILRILQKHNVQFSENLNGIFFNLCTIDQPTCDALNLFIQFTQKNRVELENREHYISTLTVVENCTVNLN